MSKHEKHVRRQRKKTDRARRLRDHFRHPGTSPTCGSAIRNGAAALAAAAAIAAGTSAYASPVRFDNPAGAGHFDWPTDGPPDLWLDVTLPAAGQPAGVTGPSRFLQLVYPDKGLVQGQGGLEIGGAYGLFLLGVDAGEVIPSGPAFGTVGYVYYSGFGSELPEGQPTYLGIKIDQGSGDQYGWIGVVRTGLELDAFAWGYETEVGVPIAAAVPEPGTLALLAFGAVAALRRRR